MIGSRGQTVDLPPHGCAVICCAVGSGLAHRRQPPPRRDNDYFHRGTVFFYSEKKNCLRTTRAHLKGSVEKSASCNLLISFVKIYFYSARSFELLQLRGGNTESVCLCTSQCLV